MEIPPAVVLSPNRHETMRAECSPEEELCRMHVKQVKLLTTMPCSCRVRISRRVLFKVQMSEYSGNQVGIYRWASKTWKTSINFDSRITANFLIYCPY